MCHTWTSVLNMEVFLGAVIFELDIQIFKLVPINDHFLGLIPLVQLKIHLIVGNESPDDLHERLNRIFYLIGKLEGHLQVEVPVLVVIYLLLLEVALSVALIIHGLQLFGFLLDLL